MLPFQDTEKNHYPFYLKLTNKVGLRKLRAEIGGEVGEHQGGVRNKCGKKGHKLTPPVLTHRCFPELSGSGH